MIEQVPGLTIVTVLADTVHTRSVVEAKLTGKPELAVALTLKGAAPMFTLLSGRNVIVCGVGLTVKLCVTVGAAA
jgi:hypothetical protein